MASRWYVRQGRQEQGPFKTSDLRRLAQEGGFAPESQVRRGEDGEWIEASRVMGLIPASHSESSPQEGAPQLAAVPQVQLPQVQLPRAQPLPAAPLRALPIAAEVPAAVAQQSLSPIPVVPAGRGLRRGRSGQKGAVLGMPVAATLAIVLVLAVSFGVAGVAIYMWRAGTEVSSDEVVAPSTPDPTAEPGIRPALAPAGESPVARDEALLADIGEWHDAAKVRVGPKATARYQIVTARLVSERELDRLGEAPHAVRRAAVESASLGAPPAASSLEAKSSAFSPLEAALGEDVGTSRELPSEIAPETVARDIESAAETPADAAALRAADDGPAADRKMLMVEVKVYNLSSQDSLHYSGLNGFADERAAALLVDQYNKRFLPLPATDGAAARRLIEVDIAPGHMLTDVLVFPAPDEGFEFVRLALPNASIGRTGGVGFQISAEMIHQAAAAASREP